MKSMNYSRKPKGGRRPGCGRKRKWDYDRVYELDRKNLSVKEICQIVGCNRYLIARVRKRKAREARLAAQPEVVISS